jgi:D-hydroxyproline dehydrogenase subunit beta
MLDVVVVGGGVVGCACARALARRGLRVTLVEQESLAAGASGRNHGLLLTPTEPLLVPMARLAMEAYLEIAEDPPLPLPLARDPVGILVVGGDDASRAGGRAEAEAARACGVAVDELGERDLRDVEPGLAPGLDSGWLLHDGRLVDPAALTVALAFQARDAGAEIRRHLPVRAILRDRGGAGGGGGRVRGVLTDDGEIAADEVVVAAGPWTGRLLRPLGFDLPLQPARGWLVHLGPASTSLRHVVEGAGWHALPGEDPMPPVTAGEVAGGRARPLVGSLLQQNADGTVLAGSSRQAAFSSEPEDPGIPREIARRAFGLVPSLESARVLGSWWGLRPMTPDGMPIVGRLADGLVVATGHGSFGVTLAAGTAPLVEALVAGGDPPIDPSPFAPGRFPPRGDAGAARPPA